MTATKKRVPATTSAAAVLQTADNIFPAVEGENRPVFNSSAERTVHISVGLKLGDKDETFVAARVDRFAADCLTVQMRDSVRGPTDASEDRGRFEVPLQLVPYLPQFFQHLWERARAEGLMESGEPFEATEEEGFLDIVTEPAL